MQDVPSRDLHGLRAVHAVRRKGNKLMDPASGLALGYLTQKLTDLIESKIRSHVIERWTRKRAVAFYRQFCAELLDGNNTDQELGTLLDELLSDDVRSEIVFEAYRLVSLSRSKTIGPRIIAVVTATIIQRDGIADDEEEAILAAAEMLGDEELKEFRDQLGKLECQNDWGEFDQIMSIKQIDSNFPTESVEIGSGSLAGSLGTWAEKLRSIGMVSDSVSESNFTYREDSEHHIDMDGVVRQITWTVHFHSPSARLAELINRVSAD
jgi:hypothetical protein